MLESLGYMFLDMLKLFFMVLIGAGGVFGTPIAVWFFFFRKDAYVEIERSYDDAENQFEIKKATFNDDRSGLDVRGIDIELPIETRPQRYDGMPFYRFYSPGQNEFIPKVSTDRIQIEVDGEKKNVRQAIPQIGYAAKEAFRGAIEDADDIYETHGAFVEFMKEWGGYLAMFMLMFVIIWQQSEIVKALGSINIPNKIQLVAKAVEQGAENATEEGAKGVPFTVGGFVGLKMVLDKLKFWE